MPERLKNWDFIGRCFDVLKIDPLKIDNSAKTFMALAIGTGKDDDDFEPTLDDRFLKPKGTRYVPLAGGHGSSSTVMISSAYDFQTFNKIENSVSVSDPTGEMFKTSLSSSYSQTRRATGSENKVLTYTSLTVDLCRLELSELEESALAVSKELVAAVAKLPPNPDPTAYDNFVKTFGTHYSSGVTFGGRAYQRVMVKEAEYSTFLEEGLDMASEAKLTFDIAAGGKLIQTDTRSKKFINTTKNSTDDIKVAGGTPPATSSGFDSWASSVASNPAPIKVDLEPLYQLLTAKLFDNDPEIETKQTLLKGTIDNYLTSKGEDVQKLEMHYQDRVFLGLRVAKGSARYLSAAASRSYARTSKIPRPSGQDASLRWVIVNTKDPNCKGKVRVNEIVALRSVSGAYLDAQAGADNTYEKGDGLTAASGVDPSVATTWWKVVLVDERKRNEIVDGDYVRLESQWTNPNEDYPGYLKGEPSADDPHQRVFSFGYKGDPGTIWMLSREAEG
jgi:MAC/Perforin domain